MQGKFFCLKSCLELGENLEFAFYKKLYYFNILGSLVSVETWKPWKSQEKKKVKIFI